MRQSQSLHLCMCVCLCAEITPTFWGWKPVPCESEQQSLLFLDTNTPELSRPRNRGKTIMTKGPTESLVDDHPKLPCNWVWMVNPVYHQKTYLTKENRSWATAIYRADMEAAFSLNNWTRQLLPSAFPWTQIWYGTIWTQRLASALRLSLSLIKFYTCSHVVWHSINFIYEITQSMDLRDVLQVWPFSFFFPES